MLGEGTDDSTKHGETLVDVRTFFESVTRGSGSGRSFRTSEINNVDARLEITLGHTCLFILPQLSEEDLGHSMSTRRRGVHVSRADGSVQRTLVNLSLDFCVATHRVKDGTLNVDALLGIFSDFESLLWSLLNLLEEIMDLLVVDLNHGDLNGVLTVWVLRLAFLNSIENLFAGLRDDTLILAIADD